jgi:antitoxin VapB
MEQAVESLVEDVMEIGRHCASLPLVDPRTPDEILGYDENGVPQ